MRGGGAQHDQVGTWHTWLGCCVAHVQSEDKGGNPPPWPVPRCRGAKHRHDRPTCQASSTVRRMVYRLNVDASLASLLRVYRTEAGTHAGRGGCSGVRSMGPPTHHGSCFATVQCWTVCICRGHAHIGPSHAICMYAWQPGIAQQHACTRVAQQGGPC
jgi:hypothetical protein